MARAGRRSTAGKGNGGGDGTREALMDAACTLFAERGFAGAKVDAIARKARVNKAMINYHFGGKQGLYTAIVASTLDAAHERLDAVRASTAPADERLALFIDVFAGAATHHPAFASMLVREVISGGQHLPPRLLPKFLQVFALVRDIVEQGVRARTFRKVDPLLTHLGLMGSLVFFFASSPFRQRLRRESLLPSEPDPTAYVAHVKALMTHGLSARRS